MEKSFCSDFIVTTPAKLNKFIRPDILDSQSTTDTFSTQNTPLIYSDDQADSISGSTTPISRKFRDRFLLNSKEQLLVSSESVLNSVNYDS